MQFKFSAPRVLITLLVAGVGMAGYLAGTLSPPLPLAAQSGQQCVPVPPPTTTPGSPALSIASSRTYRDNSLGLVVVGEVLNSGGDAADIGVVASVIDASGQTVATASDHPLMLILGHDQRVGFIIFLDDAPPQYADIHLQTESTAARELDRDYYYGDLVVEGASVQLPTNDYDRTKIVGRVRNTGSRSVESVKIMAVAAADDSSVLDANDDRAALSSIPPGGTSPFEVTWFGQKTVPAATRFTVWGSP